RGAVEKRATRRGAEDLARRAERQPEPRVAAGGDAEVHAGDGGRDSALIPSMLRRLAAVLAMAAAACAGGPGQKQELPQLSGVPASFEVSGRLAIRQDQRSDIARLRWTRAHGADEWVILSPVGSEVARIESDAHGATLTRADAPQEKAESFEALTE